MLNLTPAPYSENRLDDMLARNAEWVSQITAQDPDYLSDFLPGKARRSQ